MFQRRRIPAAWLIRALTLGLIALTLPFAVRGLYGPPGALVHIRWQPSVDAAERQRLEIEWQLVDGREDDSPGTWRYDLTVPSVERLRAIVEHAAVNDTHFIDRQRYTIEPDATRTARRHGLITVGGAVGVGLVDRLAMLLAGLAGLSILVRHPMRVVRWCWRAGTRTPRVSEQLGPAWWAAVFGLPFGLFTAVFAGFLAASNASDLTDHIEYAANIHSVRDISLPQFLFHVLLKILAVSGMSYRTAAVVVLGSCYGGMAVLLAREMARRGLAVTSFRAFVLIPAILLAAHIFLPTLFRPNLYRGYFVPTSYHSPTQQLGKVLALWVYTRYCAEFLERQAPRMWGALSLGLLCVASAIAKPSFLLAFMPVAGGIGLGDLVRRRWHRAMATAVGIAAPAVAVLLWQADVAYGQTSVAIIFAPFAVFGARETLIKLPLSLALPLFTWVAACRTQSVDVRLRFAAALTAVGFVWTLGFAESERVGHGNLAWTGQTVVFLAYVESVLFWCAWPRGRVTSRIAWGIFAIHVACGLIWFGAAFRSDWQRLL